MLGGSSSPMLELLRFFRWAVNTIQISLAVQSLFSLTLTTSIVWEVLWQPCPWEEETIWDTSTKTQLMWPQLIYCRQWHEGLPTQSMYDTLTRNIIYNTSTHTILYVKVCLQILSQLLYLPQLFIKDLMTKMIDWTKGWWSTGFTKHLAGLAFIDCTLHSIWDYSW